jgi:hypothetical protein
MLVSWAPFILLVGLWVFFMRQMQRGRPTRSADDSARLLAQLAELEELVAEAQRIGSPDHRPPADERSLHTIGFTISTSIRSLSGGL